MSEARAAVATTGTGANRPACPGELDVFDCAFPDWTRTTYALTPSKTITPRAINHGLRRLISL
jgi:hypothetical protein